MNPATKKIDNNNIDIFIDPVIEIDNPNINVPQTIAIFSVTIKKLKYVA